MWYFGILKNSKKKYFLYFSVLVQPCISCPCSLFTCYYVLKIVVIYKQSQKSLGQSSSDFIIGDVNLSAFSWFLVVIFFCFFFFCKTWVRSNCLIAQSSSFVKKSDVAISRYHEYSYILCYFKLLDKAILKTGIFIGSNLDSCLVLFFLFDRFFLSFHLKTRSQGQFHEISIKMKKI